MKGRRDVSDLAATVRQLWPDAEVRIAGPASAGRDERAFRMLLSRHNPKVLVPADTPAAASAAVLRPSAKDTYLESMFRRGLGAFAGTRLASAVFRDGIVVSPAAGRSIEAYLSEVLHEEVRVSLAIGARRANRKAVLGVHGRDGRHLGFAKVAHSELARRLVRAEVATLEHLAARPLTELVVPRVLHAGTWEAHEVVVLGALTPGPHHSRGALPAAAMRQLAAVDGEVTETIAASSWLHRLRRRVASIATADGARLLSLVDATLERHGATVLRFGAWHGDWGSWNMVWSGTRPQVWDWERFDVDVPIGMDAVHFTAHPSLRQVGRAEAGRAALRRAATQALAALDVPEDAAPAVVDCYLLEIAARFVRDASGSESDHGETLNPVARWHLDVIADRLGARAAGRRSADPTAQEAT